MNSKPMPFWTWVVPFLVCQLGTQVSLQFQFAPGVSLLYLPIPLAVAMIHWWGPRVLAGVYLNALLSAGLWGLPRMALWPLYALPENLAVFSSWAVWAFFMRTPLDLVSGKHSLRWVVFSILPAACVDGFLVPGLLVMLGDLPPSGFWSGARGEWTGTMLSGFAVATPLLYFISPALERYRLSSTRFGQLPNWIPPQRESRLTGLELFLFFATPAFISRWLPISDYWFVYAIIGIWTALRFGLALVVAWNAWAVFLVLVLPHFWPLGPGSMVTENLSLIHVHVGLGFICAVTLITGSTVHLMFAEIEARTRSETSLWRTRFSVDHSSEAMFWMNLKGQIVDANEAACISLGYAREELLRLTIPDIDPHFPAEKWADVVFILAEKGSLKLESAHRTRSGEIVPIEIVSNYIRHGEEAWICAFVRDIRERNAAQEALSQSEARFRTLVENAPDAIVVFDMGKGHFVDFNDKACKLFQLSREELLKAGPDRLSPERQPNGRPSAEMAMEKLRLAVDGQSPQFEWTHLNSRGEELTCDIRLVRLPSSGSVLIRGSIIDITERKRLEAELQRAQKLESLGILAGGIAHDFNNLIGGIYGYLDLAQGLSKEPRVAQYLENAVRSIDRARGLTQQLLTFARGGEPIKKPQSLIPVIEGAVRFALSGSKVESHFNIPGDLWICDFDRNQIGQVIDNLIINSVQAMPGGGQLFISAKNEHVLRALHPVLETGDYIAISIRDQGIGISPSNLTRIFDPFFTTKPKGHGLGLATCYSIVNRHGGHIEVESEVGEGTLFRIYLPAAKEVPSKEPEVVATPFLGSGYFILMDDDVTMRETIGDMLKAIGFDVIATENGQQALQALRQLMGSGQRIAGLLFDLTVPGHMGGREAVAQVRVIHATIPVFVASGYAEDPVMARPADFGCTGSICKPFLKADLMQMLQLHLQGQAPSPVIS